MSFELRTIKNNLPGLPETLQIALRAHLEKTLTEAQEIAKETVPVKSGELRDSIGHEITGPLSGQLTAGTDHAEAVEFGGHNTPAQAFLRPSMETVQDDFLGGIGPCVEKAATR